MDETGTKNTLWDLDAFFLDTGYSGCFFFTKCSDKNKWGVYRTKPGAVFHPRDHRWSFERVIMCKKKKKHLPKRDA
jgi:hypothetical protein